ACWDRRGIGARIGNEQILGPRTVDRIAEAPASQPTAALRMRAVETVEALSAGRDGADDDALADRIERVESGAQFLDHTYRFMAEDQSRFHGVLATNDVHIGAAD